MRFSARASRLLRTARVAHLATADGRSQPHVIPICFVFDGRRFFSPIDEKPKRTLRQKRLRNIRDNPSVARLIDHYEEDWRKLAYVLVLGKARVLRGGLAHQRAVGLLRRKYPQYRSMRIHQLPMISILPIQSIAWGEVSTPRLSDALDPTQKASSARSSKLHRSPAAGRR